MAGSSRGTPTARRAGGPRPPPISVADIKLSSPRDVAGFFEKRHDHVLRDIDAHLANPDLGRRNWFREYEYRDEQGKLRRSVDMTRDGFA
jgi:phage regulator Rha-like protein